MSKPCPFCHLDPRRIIEANDIAVIYRDGFPVSPGHTLIVPRRHVGSIFQASEMERQEFMRLLDRAKQVLDQEFQPDSYNIGLNDGPAAGQTVPHMHIHLIPRYQGDVEEPRGGVRWVIPQKAKYWG